MRNLQTLGMLTKILLGLSFSLPYIGCVSGADEKGKREETRGREANEEEGKQGNFNNYFHYEDSINYQYKGYIEKWLIDINNNKVGKQLMERIIHFLGEKGKILIFKAIENGGHSFNPPKPHSKVDSKELYVEINFKKLESNAFKARVGTFSLAEPYQGKYYPVGSMLIPFHIVLGHELIHLLHFLEDPNSYYYRCRNFDDSLWKSYGEENMKRGIWPNLEEQMTVIGDGILDNQIIQITESSLLVAEGYAPRYAYQPSENDFFEDANILRDIFQVDNFGILTREEWRFDDQKALISRLNSNAFQKEHEKQYKDARQQDEAILLDLRQTPSPVMPEHLRAKLSNRKKEKLK